jgi:predicted RNA binding protein YcfA (HicA-like mRNA interferase family)
VTALPQVTGGDVLRALQKRGFAVQYIYHGKDPRFQFYYLQKQNGSNLIIVTDAGDQQLPADTLRSILHQAGLTVDEFVESLV